MRTETYLIIRAGAIKIRLPGATIDSDGAVSVKGRRVIDGELARADGCYESVAAAAAKAQWNAIDRKYFAKVGISASGLEVISEADHSARQRATSAAELAAHPERRERLAISALYAEAERAKYADTDRYFNLRRQADDRMNAWRSTYPQAWNQERAESLRDAAEHERHLAAGALTFDMDGSLPREYQVRAHDEHMLKAAELDAQADRIAPRA